MVSRRQIREDGRAFDIENIKISVKYKDSEYILKRRDKASIGPTGEWTIFELEHADGHSYGVAKGVQFDTGEFRPERRLSSLRPSQVRLFYPCQKTL